MDSPPDADQLTQLFDRHYLALVRMAVLLVDDTGRAEELVQDAFARWASLRTPPTADAASAYLRSMVLNAARSELRRRRVRRLRPVPAAVAGDGPEAVGVARATEADVLRALRRLPDRQAEVLVLRYWMDLSEAEIAATLGISTGSVKTHAHRGLAALAGPLEALR